MHGKRFTGIIALLAAAVIASGSAPAAGIQGLWRTMDDKTHQPRGVVRIYLDDDEYSGRIVSSFNPREAHEVCEPCSGPLHNQPIVGLQILSGMREHDGEYSGGTIVDPDTGEVYRCKMTLADDGRKLTVRAYVGLALFGRTQVWTRDAPPPGMRETGGR
ncbi:MAG TPA: DUF2147 domain-containing protein [Bryobacteraceae bacterium]|nr:DUF2147 domain-containing protein [Bryobacteraceae bacterium]